MIILYPILAQQYSPVFWICLWNPENEWISDQILHSITGFKDAYQIWLIINWLG